MAGSLRTDNIDVAYNNVRKGRGVTKETVHTGYIVAGSLHTDNIDVAYNNVRLVPHDWAGTLFGSEIRTDLPIHTHTSPSIILGPFI